MIDNIEVVITQLRRCIANEDADKLKELVDNIGTYCYKESNDGEMFDNNLFNVIVEMMDEPQFLKMPGSYHLLMLLEFDWAMLSLGQKEKLLDAIARSYDKYSDWMASHVLAKLLGDNYCDEAAFTVLCELDKSSKETARSLLPMAFEYLARGSSDSTLKNKSIAELKRMLVDTSKEVQREANESISRIAQKGF
jgi:hypothetical protein